MDKDYNEKFKWLDKIYSEKLLMNKMLLKKYNKMDYYQTVKIWLVQNSILKDLRMANNMMQRVTWLILNMMPMEISFLNYKMMKDLLRV